MACFEHSQKVLFCMWKLERGKEFQVGYSTLSTLNSFQTTWAFKPQLCTGLIFTIWTFNRIPKLINMWKCEQHFVFLVELVRERKQSTNYLYIRNSIAPWLWPTWLKQGSECPLSTLLYCTPFGLFIFISLDFTLIFQNLKLQ